MNYSPYDIQHLAGEYVLGTLSAASHAGVEVRMANDAALRTAVELWQEKLAPLHTLVEPVEPSPQLWMRIESSVVANVDAAKAAASSTRTVPPDSTPITTWWNNLRLWRGLAVSGWLREFGEDDETHQNSRSEPGHGEAAPQAQVVPPSCDRG